MAPTAVGEHVLKATYTRERYTALLMPSQTGETVQGARPGDASSREATFRYKRAWAFCAWTIAVDGLAAIVVILTIRHGRVADAALFGLIFFGSFSLTDPLISGRGGVPN